MLLRRVLPAALLSVMAAACVAPTGDVHPAWLAHHWTSGSEFIDLDASGTYSYDDDDGHWSFDGTTLELKSRGTAPGKLAVEPLVACRLVKFGDTVFEAGYQTIQGCPRVEPDLTPTERCLAGRYSRHEDHAPKSNHYINVDDTYLRLSEDHYYELEVEHFETDGYVTTKGDGLIKGRWEATDDVKVRLTPITYSGLSSEPQEVELAFWVSGGAATVDGDSFTFDGGCQ